MVARVRARLPPRQQWLQRCDCARARVCVCVCVLWLQRLLLLILPAEVHTRILLHSSTGPTTAPTVLPRDVMNTPRPGRVSPRSPLYRFTPRVHPDMPPWVKAAAETLRQTSQALDVTRTALVSNAEGLKSLVEGGGAIGGVPSRSSS